MRMLSDSEKKFIDISAKILEQIKKNRPLIHIISNVVTIESLADVVLATGGIPIAAYSPLEVEEVVRRSDALLLNTGTPDRVRREAYKKAGVVAKIQGIPILLDPVGVGFTTFRSEIFREIMENALPTVLRMNWGEAKYVISDDRKSLKGVDSLIENGVEHEVVKYAKEKDLTVVVTGKKNIVTDGKNTFVTFLGNPLMKSVTGAGCMLDGVLAVFLTVKEFSVFERMAAGLTFYNFVSTQIDIRDPKQDLIYRIRTFKENV